MKWTETSIARALAVQFFNKKYLVVVPNCIWTGHECDLLAVTENLRIIDIEIKISRSDLRADAKKDKWWQSYFKDPGTGLYRTLEPKQCRKHPPKVWKHYYALPADIWTPSLLDALPSKSSGVLLLRTQQYDGALIATCERRAVPCKDAETISPAAAVDIARLASLRMWESYKALDDERNRRLDREKTAA